MITQDAFTTGKMVTSEILSKMTSLNKKKRIFVLEILLLYLSIRGRMNFLQMSREGNRVEKSYRYQFEQTFDWLGFNRNLISTHCNEEVILGFDPSYIRKSGKHSPGLGHFYSGCAGMYKRGLEIASIAAIDIAQHTAYHVEAIQSPSAYKDRINKSTTMTQHYAEIIVQRSKELKRISSVLVFDAYFTKKKFVDRICEEAGFEMVGRLRDDANLNYVYEGKSSKGKGRPRKYSGKINVKKIDKRKIKKIYQDEDCTLFHGVVYSVGLKRKIQLAYVEHHLKTKTITKLYFSTNLERDPQKILQYYRARYQMEYIFRDAKQHMGLEHCQARSKNKLNFHFNASMTAVSVAKLIARQGMNKSEAKSISISNIKMEMQNRNMIDRIFSIYGIAPKLIKNNSGYNTLLNFGKIAA